jgi:hypothetical protein
MRPWPLCSTRSARPHEPGHWSSLVGNPLWSIWGAPKAKWPLQGRWFLLLRMVFFSSAVVALCFAGQYIVGVIFALLTVLFLVLTYTQ